MAKEMPGEALAALGVAGAPTRGTRQPMIVSGRMVSGCRRCRRSTAPPPHAPPAPRPVDTIQNNRQPITTLPCCHHESAGRLAPLGEPPLLQLSSLTATAWRAERPGRYARRR